VTSSVPLIHLAEWLWCFVKCYHLFTYLLTLKVFHNTSLWVVFLPKTFWDLLLYFSSFLLSTLFSVADFSKCAELRTSNTVSPSDDVSSVISIDYAACLHCRGMGLQAGASTWDLVHFYTAIMRWPVLEYACVCVFVCVFWILLDVFFISIV